MSLGGLAISLVTTRHENILCIRRGEDLDLGEGGSGIDSDADLSFLPDPDEVRRRYAEQGWLNLNSRLSCPIISPNSSIGREWHQCGLC